MVAAILIALKVLGGILLCIAGLILYISWAIEVAVYLDDRTRLPNWACMLIGLLVAPWGLVL